MDDQRMDPQVPSQLWGESTDIGARQAMQSRLRGSASWFFAIAGLSLLNSVISLFNGSLTFVIGLGVSQIVDVAGILLSEEFPSAAIIIKAVAFGLSLILAGIFTAFGFFGRQGRRWAFIVGMVLYAFDAILVVLFQDVIGFVFHLVALFFLFSGLRMIGSIEDQQAKMAGHPFGGSNE